jgi:carboxymethylenebutenolidase
MTDLLRYLTEEIATDHADGLLTRREALRRLGLLGVSAAAASTLLIACEKPSVDGPAAPVGSTTGATTTQGTATAAPGTTTAAPGTATAAPGPAPGTPAAPGEPITFKGPEGRTLQASWSAAAVPRGGVLVLHENRGLTEHFRNFTGRFAKKGYSSLALDLLSEEGGTASLGDSANATAALGKVAPERFVADMKAALGELARRAPGVKLGAIGFCFGGAMTWRLIASKDPRLAAAVPFYGPVPDGADFTGSKAAVLAVYAELDARVNASRDAAKAALEKAKLTHEIVTYPGVDHAFFNDTGQRYNADGAAKAWEKVLEWFERHLA